VLTAFRSSHSQFDSVWQRNHQNRINQYVKRWARPETLKRQNPEPATRLFHYSNRLEACFKRQDASPPLTPVLVAASGRTAKITRWTTRLTWARQRSKERLRPDDSIDNLASACRFSPASTFSALPLVRRSN
jgi:hypothetical protein